MLQPGITYQRNLSLTEIRAACFPAARAIGATVVEVKEPGVTPSFFTSTLRLGERDLRVLCSAAYPVVAFAEPFEVETYPIPFTDHQELAAAFKAQGFRCVSVAELSEPLSQIDPSPLEAQEMADIKSWQPTNLGEILFNSFE